jgi:hypothetical protein
MSKLTAPVDRLAKAALSMFDEVWKCGRCGREFGDATACCTHEAQCGVMTHC